MNGITSEYFSQDVDFTGKKELKIIRYLSEVTDCYVTMYVRLSIGYGNPIYLYYETLEQIDTSPVEIKIDLKDYQGVYTLEIGAGGNFSGTSTFTFDIYEVWFVTQTGGQTIISMYPGRIGTGIPTFGGGIPWGP